LCWMDSFSSTESKHFRNTQFCFVRGRRRRRQGQCKQVHAYFSSMDFSLCFNSPIISTLVHFLLLVSLVCPVCSSEIGNYLVYNESFGPKEEVHKFNIIRNHLNQLNKPSIKTIQVSPELYGDSYPRFFTYWTFLRLIEKLNFVKQVI
ncbi:hypothetical protein TanjilG_15959, partial [Lupinus angustifolius]